MFTCANLSILTFIAATVVVDIVETLACAHATLSKPYYSFIQRFFYRRKYVWMYTECFTVMTANSVAM